MDEIKKHNKEVYFETLIYGFVTSISFMFIMNFFIISFNLSEYWVSLFIGFKVHGWWFISLWILMFEIFAFVHNKIIFKPQYKMLCNFCEKFKKGSK